MLEQNQLEAIQLMTYTNKTDAEIAKELDVNPCTIWRWKQCDEFMSELEKETRKKFRILQRDAMKAMERLIEDNNFNAAKYILDGNGFAPTEKHEMNLEAEIKVDYGN